MPDYGGWKQKTSGERKAELSTPKTQTQTSGGGSTPIPQPSTTPAPSLSLTEAERYNPLLASHDIRTQVSTSGRSLREVYYEKLSQVAKSKSYSGSPTQQAQSRDADVQRYDTLSKQHGEEYRSRTGATYDKDYPGGSDTYDITTGDRTDQIRVAKGTDLRVVSGLPTDSTPAERFRSSTPSGSAPRFTIPELNLKGVQTQLPLTVKETKPSPPIYSGLPGNRYLITQDGKPTKISGTPPVIYPFSPVKQQQAEMPTYPEPRLTEISNASQYDQLQKALIKTTEQKRSVIQKAKYLVPQAEDLLKRFDTEILAKNPVQLPGISRIPKGAPEFLGSLTQFGLSFIDIAGEVPKTAIIDAPPLISSVAGLIPDEISIKAAKSFKGVPSTTETAIGGFNVLAKTGNILVETAKTTKSPVTSIGLAKEFKGVPSPPELYETGKKIKDVSTIPVMHFIRYDAPKIASEIAFSSMLFNAPGLISKALSSPADEIVGTMLKPTKQAGTYVSGDQYYDDMMKKTGIVNPKKLPKPPSTFKLEESLKIDVGGLKVKDYNYRNMMEGKGLLIKDKNFKSLSMWDDLMLHGTPANKAWDFKKIKKAKTAFDLSGLPNVKPPPEQYRPTITKIRGRGDVFRIYDNYDDVLKGLPTGSQYKFKKVYDIKGLPKPYATPKPRGFRTTKNVGGFEILDDTLDDSFKHLFKDPKRAKITKELSQQNKIVKLLRSEGLYVDQWKTDQLAKTGAYAKDGVKAIKSKDSVAVMLKPLTEQKELVKSLTEQQLYVPEWILQQKTKTGLYARPVHKAITKTAKGKIVPAFKFWSADVQAPTKTKPVSLETFNVQIQQQTQKNEWITSSFESPVTKRDTTFNQGKLPLNISKRKAEAITRLQNNLVGSSNRSSTTTRSVFDTVQKPTQKQSPAKITASSFINDVISASATVSQSKPINISKYKYEYTPISRTKYKYIPSIKLKRKGKKKKTTNKLDKNIILKSVWKPSALGILTGKKKKKKKKYTAGFEIRGI